MRIIVVKIGTFADGKGTGSYQLFGEVAGDVFERLDCSRLRAVAGYPEDRLFRNDPVPLEKAFIRLRRLRDALADL